ncbi:MAG: CapA family protein [Ardenticatenaceae bacterium]|nr:CapA family protein [Ardenticatenaceae bacterium]
MRSPRSRRCCKTRTSPWATWSRHGHAGRASRQKLSVPRPPVAAEALALAGFDVVSLANNHGMDYGQRRCCKRLSCCKRKASLRLARSNFDAAHTPYITQINGLSLAILAYVNVPIEARSAFDTAV